MEEVTASAQTLAELANALQGVVAQFKLESGLKSEGLAEKKAGMKVTSSGNGHRIVHHN